MSRRNNRRRQQEPVEQAQDPMQMIMGLMGLMMQMQQHEGKMDEQQFTNRRNAFEEDRWPETAENAKTAMVLQLLNSAVGHRVDDDKANAQFERQGLDSLINPMPTNNSNYANPNPYTPALEALLQQHGRQR